jgi:hypothetical protein
VRVAILSAMETVNPKVPSTVEAGALCKMADRGQITGAVLDGPLALDNAISLESVKIKKIESPVAGRANVLIVPDLEAGNMLAKKPVVHGRRGCGRHRARRTRSHHPDEPGRLGHDAAGLVRDRSTGRTHAPRGSRQGRGVMNALPHARRSPHRSDSATSVGD